MSSIPRDVEKLRARDVRNDPNSAADIVLREVAAAASPLRASSISSVSGGQQKLGYQ